MDLCPSIFVKVFWQQHVVVGGVVVVDVFIRHQLNDIQVLVKLVPPVLGKLN